MMCTSPRLRRCLAGGIALATFASLGTAGAVSAKTTKKRAVAKKAVAKKATTKKATASTASTNPAPSVAKGTIKLGTLYSSISATTGGKTLEETRRIAEQWKAKTAAAGGINGYKVEVVAMDTKNDSSRALAAIKQMDKDGIVALAGQGAPAQLPAIADYLTSKAIPVIGGAPYTPEFESNPMFFPVPSALLAGSYGFVATARDMGAKHFRNLYCAEIAVCAQLNPT